MSILHVDLYTPLVSLLEESTDVKTTCVRIIPDHHRMALVPIPPAISWPAISVRPPSVGPVRLATTGGPYDDYDFDRAAELLRLPCGGELLSTAVEAEEGARVTCCESHGERTTLYTLNKVSDVVILWRVSRSLTELERPGEFRISFATVRKVRRRGAAGHLKVRLWQPL